MGLKNVKKEGWRPKYNSAEAVKHLIA
jgi:hypothetical protein